MACRVGPDHWRPRKTGPRFALQVMHCHSHGLAFTLYPPGHVPYGRRLVAPVSPDGQLMHPAPGTDRVQGFRGTVFDAAIDLAEGSRWPRTWERAAAEPGHEHTTQWRWIHRLARLIGVAPALSERTRHAVARALGIPTLVMREQARSATDLTRIACAIVALLSHLPQGPTVLTALLASGAEVGLWGQVERWDPTHRVLRSIAVPSGGTRDPP